MISMIQGSIEKMHCRYIVRRRAEVLSSLLGDLIPAGSEVLDVGCGDGLLMSKIVHNRPDIQAQGVDVVLREQNFIPVKLYDGREIPFPGGSFDCVLLVDVLHHSQDIPGLLQACLRVVKKRLIIKDHLLHGFLAGRTLQLMDWTGNRRFDVNLDCCYLAPEQWRELFKRFGLKISCWSEDLGLYPWPLSLLFERRLHFLAALEKSAEPSI